MRYILSFFALVWLVCNQANADGITWSRSIISASNSLPSSTNTSVYTTTLSKYSPLSPNFSWRINDTFGDCSAVTLSPSYGNFISSVDVTVQVNWTLYNVVTTSQCTIVAQTTDGQTALLTVNIAVTSTLCNYQPDPFRFCKAKHLSVNVYCKNDTGVCTCTENHFGLICQFCDPSVTCSGRGTCDQNAKCVCEPGYYGGDCSVTCNRTTNCSGNGNCLPNGSCKCDDGFVSSDCSIQCSRAVNCSKAGDCRADGTCTCDWYAFGDKCQYKKCPKCVHGTCNPQTGICDCEANWFADTCNVYCSREETCNGHGTCNRYGECICDDNYYGLNCTRECSATTCLNGYCTSSGGCKCNLGYYGPRCDKYCSSSTCDMGTCDQNTGTCTCFSNYFGSECRTRCVASECLNGGRCDENGACVNDGAITGSENDSLSTGAIAGIIVAGVAGIVIAVVVIVVIARKRKARVEYVDGYQLLNTKK